MIQDDKIAEIRAKVDITNVVSEYVALRRLGRSLRGLCPFHSEKTPSFYVHPDRQYFHCFGCQASGDTIAFVMQMENRTFVEAVELLAERTGVELSYANHKDSAERLYAKKRQERLWEILEAAASFYADQWSHGKGAEMAREELKKRRVTEEVQSLFRLGYAPQSWDALTLALQRKGFALDECEEVGLVVRKNRVGGQHEASRDFYDRFRHRLMFPIMDERGHVVAFSGRALALPRGTEAPSGDPPAKYINSPETAFYKKGEMLFGLYQARAAIRKENWAVVCEGNFDVLALHEAGLPNVVAPLGTALTPSHAALLRRQAERVVLFMDGDAAGRNAVRASFTLLAPLGLEVRVATLSPGEDPDSWLRSQGTAALRTVVESANPALRWLIDQAAEEAGVEPMGKAKAIEGLGAFMRLVQNPVEGRMYLEYIMSRFGIHDPQAVRSQLIRGIRSKDKPSARQNPSPPVARAPALSRLSKLECEVMGALLDAPELFQAPEINELQKLLQPQLALLLSRAQEQFMQRGMLDANTLLSETAEGPLRNWLADRLSIQQFDSAEAQSALLQGISMLKKRFVEKELPKLAKRIDEARRSGNEDEARLLAEQHLQLARSAHRAMQQEGKPN